jgi:hypothetical protein
MNTKDTIYLDNSTTAADMIRRRDAIRAVSNKLNLRFISTPRIVCKPLQERSIIEPSSINHKTIREVV